MELARTIESIITSLALFGAGAWAYYRYVHHGERSPRAEFDLEIEVIGEQADHWLLEVNALVRNKGSVRHQVQDPKLELRFLRAGDDVVDGGASISGQTVFGHTTGRRDLPWGGYIEPGVEHRNSYLASLPRDATFGVALSSFRYGNEVFPVQKGFALPRLERSN